MSHSATPCPNCTAPMTEQTLAGHMGTTVTIDVCFPCQAFWFDGRESLQLTPASTLALFRVIGEHTAPERRPFGSTQRCPRCALRLSLVQDMQRATRFHYRRCAREHGRFITFFDFLREKDFIKPLSAEQLADLRQHLGAVNCSNCGASIDLAHHSACAHCGSALSVLDSGQAERLVAQLKAADTSGRPVDPTLPLRLEHARREVERQFESLQRDTEWYSTAASSGLLVAGLRALARWTRD